MTPKEKAKQLFSMFRTLENGSSWINNYNAKQCALLAVNEILAVIPSEISGGQGGAVYPHPQYTYYQEVKQEVENL